MVVNQRVDGPFAFFPDPPRPQAYLQSRIPGVRWWRRPSATTATSSGSFLAIFENDEIVTIDKIGAAAH